MRLQGRQSVTVAAEVLDTRADLHDQQIKGVDGINLWNEVLEYGRGERRALPSIDHVLIALRMFQREQRTAASFRESCEERDRLIAELLGNYER